MRMRQGTCSLLRRLNSKLGPTGGYRGYLIAGTDTNTGQNVALLTRVDPVTTLYRTSATSPYPVSVCRLLGARFLK